VYSVGELQADVLPSRLQVNPLVAPLAENVNVAVVLVTFPEGPESIVTVGGVPSYLKSALVFVVRPAPFVQVPVTEADVLSGPLYVTGLEHEAPEIASDPLNVTVTGWLYQPLGASGGRSASAEAEGPLLSTLTVTDTDSVRSAPFVAVQVNVVPAVSPATFASSQPDELAIPDSGSATLHVTVALLVYQSSAPVVPLTAGVITGGVVSESSPMAPEASARASTAARKSARPTTGPPRRSSTRRRW
jgi:hypothetical protein